MGFFSRNNKALDGSGVDAAPFETVRRSPRNTRARSAADSRFDASPALDPADSIRRRARHRLIGAIALALAAIVFVPMLFNATPVTPPDDIALQIPDRDTPFEGRRGVPEPVRGLLKPAGDAPPPVEAPTAVPAPSAAVEPKVTEAPAAVVVADPPAKAPAPVVEKPPAAPPEKAPTDDPRALAALDGRPDAGKKAAPVEAAGGRTFAVQVAAYASADTARAERDRLAAGGLKAYTESVSTSQGLRIRVRLGPFVTREAADQARVKLKTLKLDGSVVPL